MVIRKLERTLFCEIVECPVTGDRGYPESKHAVEQHGRDR